MQYWIFVDKGDMNLKTLRTTAICKYKKIVSEFLEYAVYV